MMIVTVSHIVICWTMDVQLVLLLLSSVYISYCWTGPHNLFVLFIFINGLISTRGRDKLDGLWTETLDNIYMAGLQADYKHFIIGCSIFYAGRKVTKGHSNNPVVIRKINTIMFIL